MKKIPNEILWQAYAEAVVPVKKLTPQSVAIWEAVVNLKASTKAKHGVKIARERLMEAISAAPEADLGSVMDEVAKAQTRADVTVTRRWKINCPGRDEVHLTKGAIGNPPRSPVTLAIIVAIMELQRDARRAPTRQEILDAVGKARAGGLSEDELSSQLTKLGWNDILS